MNQQEDRPILSLAKIVWLNTYFGIGFFLVSLAFAVLGPIFVGGHFLLFRDKRRTLRVLRRTISRYGWAVIASAWPLVKVQFIDDAPDARPPFVFVANHRSASDAFLMACLPFECVQVVNIWPFKIPFVRIAGGIAGYLRVREMPFEDFVRDGSKLLAEGVSIIAFPEGTRSGSREMGPFHGSAFRLAQQAKAPVVPLAVSGNEDKPRKGTMYLRPGQIVVRKLPAIPPDQYAGLTPFELKTLVRDTIQAHLDALDGVSHAG